jgi:hypothetical protein
MASVHLCCAWRVTPRMVWIVLLVAGLGVAVWRHRVDTLFVLGWRDDRLRLVRGRIPPLLRADLEKALAQMRVGACKVVARRAVDRARLTVSGVDDFYVQRLRNNFQLYTVAQLRAAPQSKLEGLWPWLFG